VAAWFVLVLGLFAVSSSLLLYWRVRRARSYVAVRARIIDRSIAGAFVDGVPVGRRYTLRVKYAYQVDGREFVGERFGFVQRHFSYREAEERLAKLPDELTVHVDPRAPADAVVDKRGAGIAVLLGSVGVVMLVIAYVAFNV
jgi:hypothetical protein